LPPQPFPLGLDLQVKFGGAKDTEKHQQKPAVRAKDLDAPANCCVGYQGICIASIEEKVVDVWE